ncbi:LysM peptidoglycan-binding domain-containing protein [Alkalihalophilus marmarensis]|uniref:LysM peptidoglycan-binding domain-containing protein n=1 Tax=Alkalihalophilus marmarensis TaxID=521377 RepID=UPI002DBDAACC|nr:LysM peptidoglycan-binding domain-containing protein [Alkalihalophilus marmarensis]MEC2074391.1 G5 domain-containing protein [Alkalihalophilus marmarensis]
MSSEDLNALTNSEQNSDNKKQVLDVSYSTQPTITSLDDILSVDEAVNYIIKGILQEKEYLIQQGDALSTIAPKYQLTIDELLKLNPEYKNDHVLQIGQPLMVTDYQPLTDIIVKEQLNKAEEIEFETNIVEDDTMYKGDSKIKQQGKNGKKVFFINSQKRIDLLLKKK